VPGVASHHHHRYISDVTFALLIAALALAPQQSAHAAKSAANAQAVIQQAAADAAAGNLDTAEGDYTAALARSSDDATLRVGYGDFLLTQHRYADAIAQFQLVLSRAPHRLDAEVGLATAYRGAHNFDEAKRILLAAHTEHPADARPLTDLGDLEIEAQTYDAAIAHLKSAVAINPGDVGARERLVIAYKAKGDSANALTQASAVIARDPKNAIAYFTRAELYSDQNKNALALKDAERVVELQPRNPRARALLGKILLRTPGEETSDQALARCKHAVEILEPLGADAANPPDSDSLFMMARAYQCAGQADKAAETNAAFEKSSKNDRATKENQTQAKHLVEQANGLAQKNDLNGAAEILNQAIELDPAYGLAYSQLAKIYYSEGKLDEASDAIAKALERDANQPDFLYVRGKIYERQNRPDGALADFQRTVAIDPKESDAYFEIGQILQHQGDRTGALKAYEAAARLAPDDPDFKRALDSLRTANPN
jgi:tetratricopeptide (TPR) repeat protein